MDSSNLDQIVGEAKEPVVVQFWSPWSASCTVMTTILDELAGDPSVPFHLVRVKMDGGLDSPNPYGVLTVPTLHIFFQGELRHQIIGLTNEQWLRERLDSIWKQPRKNHPDTPAA